MSEKSDFRSDAMRELSLSEASGLMREIAGHRSPDESVKGVLRRVGRTLSGWSASRVRAVWYRDTRVRLRSDEIDQLRAAARQRADKAAQNELAELKDRISRLETLLAVQDEAFHGPHVAALREIQRDVG